jgi:hypothetical protein
MKEEEIFNIQVLTPVHQFEHDVRGRAMRMARMQVTHSNRLTSRYTGVSSDTLS